MCAYFQILYIEVNTLTTYKGSFYFSLYSKNYTRLHLDASFKIKKNNPCLVSLCWISFFFYFVYIWRQVFHICMVLFYNLPLISCCLSFILKSKILLRLFFYVLLFECIYKDSMKALFLQEFDKRNIVNVPQTNEIIGFRVSYYFW